MSKIEELRHKYLSGIKPTGELTLGNYLGVIQPGIKLKSNVLMFIADMHAFTVPEATKNVSKNTEQLIKIFNMYGLDFFIQSRIAEHNQLGYVMEYLSKDWELRNQIQYKEKKGKETRASLLTYPALMAADCLMYDIPYILVGEDQMSHIHLMKDLVRSFEREFSKNVFIIPEGRVSKFSKIKDLRDPSKKMSKSNGDNGCILLFDDPEEAYKKITKAVTDSENIIKYNEKDKPGVSNLLKIYSGLTDMSIEDIELKYSGIHYPYGPFKKDLGEIVKNFLINFQKGYEEASDEVNLELEKELKNKARENLNLVLSAMGMKTRG